MGFLSPHTIVEHFDIKEGSIVADFNVDGGFFIVPLAEKVGPYGKVYAVDTNAELVKRVVCHAKECEHHNVISVQDDVFSGEMVLPEYMDVIVLSNPFSRKDMDSSVFKHAYRHLKPQGKLIVIDYLQPDQQSFQAAEYAGFVSHRKFNAGDYHHGIVFKKI